MKCGVYRPAANLHDLEFLRRHCVWRAYSPRILSSYAEHRIRRLVHGKLDFDEETMCRTLVLCKLTFLLCSPQRPEQPFFRRVCLIEVNSYDD